MQHSTNPDTTLDSVITLGRHGKYVLQAIGTKTAPDFTEWTIDISEEDGADVNQVYVPTEEDFRLFIQMCIEKGTK